LKTESENTMKSLTTINGKPVESPEQDAAKAEVKVPSATHRPECGDVGDTGDHGDLGSNAAETTKK
jgi:hypothetical protein